MPFSSNVVGFVSSIVVSILACTSQPQNHNAKAQKDRQPKVSGTKRKRPASHNGEPRNANDAVTTSGRTTNRPEVSLNQQAAEDLARAIRKSDIRDYSLDLTFDRGKVQLMGTVPDANSKHTIISVVKKDKRVTSVVCKLKIGRIPNLNQTVAKELARAIIESGIRHSGLELTFDGANVELAGTVQDAKSKQSMIAVVKKDKRVTKVVCKLKIDPTPRWDILDSCPHFRLLRGLWQMIRPMVTTHNLKL
jgi:hypothetical protein